MDQLTFREKLALVAVVLAIALIYYASNPTFLFSQLFVGSHQSLHERLHVTESAPYAWLAESNYSYRFAEAILQGKLGLTTQPPSWLNEMILLDGKYYSVFSLGSVLTMAPVVLLRQVFSFPPAGLVVALLGGGSAFLIVLISLSYERSFRHSVGLAVFATLGSWLWTNTAMGGAWQLTLGFALLGELGTIFFLLSKRQPVLAGCCFALAFGNRTEVILVAPVFIYLLWRNTPEDRRRRVTDLAKFCTAPVGLGIATLIYNYARFSSPIDFGLARIPGVLREPWYQHGIFSIHAVRANAWQMLFEPWHRTQRPPYFLPSGFGGSIFLNAPYLFCIFASGRRHRDLQIAAWCAIALLTFVYWFHGNTGGWQFSYRGAIVMLPWLFLLLLEKSRIPVPRWQSALLVTSVAINAFATYLFLWTNWITP